MQNSRSINAWQWDKRSDTINNQCTKRKKYPLLQVRKIRKKLGYEFHVYFTFSVKQINFIICFTPPELFSFTGFLFAKTRKSDFITNADYSPSDNCCQCDLDQENRQEFAQLPVSQTTMPEVLKFRR